MAATLDGIAALAVDTVFQSRVKAALARCAAAIAKESMDADTPTPLDKARRDLAVDVIENLDGFVPRFAWLVAQIPAVESGIDDAALILAVRGVWNHLARLPM
ncbi:hypothetical protein [Saccharopolyspora mangrovi]|uniref:Uncharacterized protein n=1 Tax=Saccharopolyspora mangrovi TaxID=3082379 RepID=A0ABU6A7R9_9PSEU|nr:hypothetical protein [Saccharopolyspora sp. S2-29]MEB3367425.1 hypothetical protein [Saccharopolyspora sp. S2-29]